MQAPTIVRKDREEAWQLSNVREIRRVQRSRGKCINYAMFPMKVSDVKCEHDFIASIRARRSSV